MGLLAEGGLGARGDSRPDIPTSAPWSASASPPPPSRRSPPRFRWAASPTRGWRH